MRHLLVVLPVSRSGSGHYHNWSVFDINDRYIDIDDCQVMHLTWPYSWSFSGKPLGNGHPMAVVVTKSSIASCLGVEQLASFSCDNVSAAIGSAVVNVIRNENLQLNARNVGSFLREGLKGLANDHRYIGNQITTFNAPWCSTWPLTFPDLWHFQETWGEWVWWSVLRLSTTKKLGNRQRTLLRKSVTCKIQRMLKIMDIN